ncbi:Ig-like domain repeat protein [Cellulosimicrobium terreum]|nr:Ig-like domain repeat protein [Cellulosimicrobium terreum]
MTRPSRSRPTRGTSRAGAVLLALALGLTGLVAPTATASVPALPAAPTTPTTPVTPVTPGPDVVVDHEPFRYDSPRSDVRSPLRALADTDVHALHVVLLDPAWASGSGKPSTGWITDAQLTDLTDEVSQFWVDQSDGTVRTSVASVTRFPYAGADCSTTEGILDIWNRAGTSRYGSGWISSETRGPAEREHFVVLAPYAGSDLGETTCDGTLGLGTLPATASTGNGGVVFGLYGGRNAAQLSDGAHTLAHELGHNLGLEHAGSVWCDRNVPDPNLSTFPADCFNLAYVDSYDVMGTALAPNVGVPALSSPGRARLGVHKDHVLSPTYGTTDVRLSPLGSGTGKQAVSVVDPASRSRYYVEFRDRSAPWPGHAVDLRPGLPLRFGDGVRIVRLAPTDSWDAFKNEQVLLPQGTPSSRTSTLAAGRSFTTATGALTITTRAVSGSGSTRAADVRIVVRARPSVTLTTSRTSQTYQDPAVARVTATVGAVAGSVPAGTITIKSGAVRLASAVVPTSGGAAGKVTLALPKSISARKHSITAVFSPADTQSAVRVQSAPTTVTVNKARPGVRVSLSPSTAARGRTVTATVTITMTGVTNGPSGHTSIYVDGARVATTYLTSTDRGTFRATLPKTLSRGTHTVTAVYAGNDNILRVTSPATRVTIT